MTASEHHHYFDHGYKAWQCVECNTGGDECEILAQPIGTVAGCRAANRWPMGLRADHPAFIEWAEKEGL